MNQTEVILFGLPLRRTLVLLFHHSAKQTAYQLFSTLDQQKNTQVVRPLIITFFVCFTYCSVHCQYYLRGELKDEQGNGLQNARIYLYSKGTYPYYTGSSGTFGIPVSGKTDTLTFTLEGYDTLKTAVNTTLFGSFMMKATNRKAASATLYLSSFTKNLKAGPAETSTDDGETYSSTIENQFVDTKNYSETGFALHIDKASYSNIRRFLNEKEKPPPDAVRIEEMLNYFNFRTRQQSEEQTKTFRFSSRLTSCPWNAKNQLLFINLQAKKINLDKTPPANLVFLIDVSGSMDMPNRLPLVKSAFKLLSENLRKEDLVSIVTYGDNVTLLLEPTSGSDKQKIISAIEGLIPQGATAGASAIRTAYNVARQNFMPHGNNRIVLATDGDFNIGQTSEKDLEDIISEESKSGIYLTCLGVGMGNYKDSKLEALAKKGNGNFAYMDTEKEAEKVLTEEFAQTLYSVANNVYMNVRFNPAYVKEYRLIGYDNKKSAVADKKTELEGGEIGSGHSLIAAFEIVPLGDTLNKINAPETIATAYLSYKTPATDQSVKEEYPVAFNYCDLSQADSSLRFATAVIMFGTLLKQSAFAENYSWDEVENLAASSATPANLLQKEMTELIEKAKKIYSKKKKLPFIKSTQ